MNMKRHCLGAAIALASGLPQAHAQAGAVSIYGTADGGFYAKELAGEGKVSRIEGGLMTTSRWGIRATEDLGDGLTAFFDLGGHFRLDTGEPGRHAGDTAAGRFWSRFSFVGLRGRFGQVRLGRIPTGSFVSTLSFTPFGDSTVLGPFMLHTFVGAQPMLASHGISDGSWSNSIAYNSPQWAGFSAALQIAAREGGTDGRKFDGTVNYRSGPLAAALSYSKVDHAAYTLPRSRTDPTGAPYVVLEETSALGSVSYDFKVVQLYAQLASARLQPRGLPEISLDTVGLNAAVPVGAGRVIAAIARTQREQAGVSDRARTTVSAGYAYNLSKRTDVYGVVMHDRATGLNSGTGYALGVRHHF